MCGIAGLWDKTDDTAASGRVMLTMLNALACRGPDSAGIALIGPAPAHGREDVWSVRMTLADDDDLAGLHALGQLLPPSRSFSSEPFGATRRFDFRPSPE